MPKGVYERTDAKRSHHHKGRLRVKQEAHPKADHRGYVTNAVLVAESALGRYLPEGAQVHHIDGNPSNDASNNLVVCESRAFHLLLHKRTRAYAATGMATARKCCYCKQWGSEEEVSIYSYHKSCVNAYNKLHPKKREVV
jgi:hypothetical protein